MEQRKLIKLGNSSFAIALPKPWIEKSGLKKGDNIFITPNANGELVIQSEYKKLNGSKEALIELKGKNKREINRELISAYINGNSTLDIKSISDVKFVKSVLKDLFGMEITESKGDSIIAKDMIDVNSISIPGITRRIDNSIRNMIEELMPCIKKGFSTKNQYNEILSADKDVNKLYFLLWRLMILGIDNPGLLNILKTDSSSLVYVWLIAMNLERIGDDIKRIARILSEKKLQEDEIRKTEEVFQKIKDNFINALNSYHKKDKEMAFLVTKNKEEVYAFCFKSAESLLMKEMCDKIVNIQANIHNIAKYTLYFVK